MYIIVNKRKRKSTFFVLVMDINKSTKKGKEMKRRKRGTGYINYDYENTFDKNLEDVEEWRIREALKAGRLKGIYATKTIKAGVHFEIEIYPEYTRRQAKEQGVKKAGKAQRDLNDRNARKRLRRLIECNFTDRDYWITLTYDKEHEPKDEEEALKNMQNYIKRINYKRKKEKIEKARYIYITERGEGKRKRYHHHVLMDGQQSMDAVEKLWKMGKRNNVRRVAADENGLGGLAEYLTKESMRKRRWCASTNLKQPIERKNHKDFSGARVQRIATGREDIKETVEKKYKDMEYISTEIRYNDKNKRYYIYVRMRERRKRE